MKCYQAHVHTLAYDVSQFYNTPLTSSKIMVDLRVPNLFSGPIVGKCAQNEMSA